ncbi:hypothetical protein TNCV_207881 [Trichonephila clavipes]|nr:hypothetical protein TNCV_207881 [Trichonephila clavipes]
MWRQDDRGQTVLCPERTNGGWDQVLQCCVQVHIPSHQKLKEKTCSKGMEGGSKSIHQWERTLKEKGTLAHLQLTSVLFVIEGTVDRVRDSCCRSLDKSIRQTSNDIPFRSITSL